MARGDFDRDRVVPGIAELLRAARVPGAASDPEFFARKAALFERIAAEDPSLADEAAELAANARARVRRLAGGAP